VQVEDDALQNRKPSEKQKWAGQERKLRRSRQTCQPLGKKEIKGKKRKILTWKKDCPAKNDHNRLWRLFRQRRKKQIDFHERENDVKAKAWERKKKKLANSRPVDQGVCSLSSFNEKIA